MTDDSKDAAEPNEAAEPNGALPQQFDRDWFLQHVVNLVNRHGISLGITLNVGGLIVSGALVGGKEYFEGLAAHIGKEAQNELGKAFEEMIKGRAAIYTDMKEGQPLPGFIHLRDAKCFVPGQRPMPNKGVWWRGKLSDVQGFSFGTLQVD